MEHEFNYLYSSPKIVRVIKSRRLRWADHVAFMGDSRPAYRVLMGKPKVKRLRGRPRPKWEDNIKIGLQEVGWGHGLDQSGSGQGQVVGTCECGNEHSVAIQCWDFHD